MAAECCRGGAQHGAEIYISLRKVKLKENALHIVCLALILVVLSFRGPLQMCFKAQRHTLLVTSRMTGERAGRAEVTIISNGKTMRRFNDTL